MGHPPTHPQNYTVKVKPCPKQRSAENEPVWHQDADPVFHQRPQLVRCKETQNSNEAQKPWIECSENGHKTFAVQFGGKSIGSGDVWLSHLSLQHLIVWPVTVFLNLVWCRDPFVLVFYRLQNLNLLLRICQTWHSWWIPIYTRDWERLS